jgi:hypothetical protein
MSARDFGLDVFGLNVAVLTDDPEARDILDRYLLPWVPRAPAALRSADAVFRIRRNESGGGFDAHAADRPIASNGNLPAIVELLQSSVDEAMVRRLSGLAAVHAGVVGWNGGAAILPGPSHAGKTTLVAELLRHGAVYFSDEYALIDAEGRVHPYALTRAR